MSENDPVENVTVPKVLSQRAAARKASQLAAEQLGGSSEDEGGEGPTFGEPSTPKSPIKRTYGGKRKYKQTPPTPREALTRTRSRTSSLVETSPNMPRMNGVGRGRGAASRGRNGRRQRSARARSISSCSSIENDSMVLSSPVVALEEGAKSVRSPRRNTISGGGSREVHARAGDRQGETGKGPRKRPLSLLSSKYSGGDDSSSLTSLSSTEGRELPGFPPTSNIAPRLARQFLRTQSQAHPSTVSHFKYEPITQSKSLDNLFAPLDSTDDEGFDEADTGSMVWVSINSEGTLTDCAERQGHEDTLWWPAKVVLPKPLLQVSLFGRPPGHADSADSRYLNVGSPSTTNVRSMMLGGRMRFNESNYRLSRRNASQASPRKKRKLDVDAAWREACDLMAKAGEDGEDDLLSGPLCYTSSRQADGAANGKGKWKASDSDLDGGSILDFDFKPDRPWRAPSANPLLEIPGELVLAREGRARTQYWPAKLLEYIPPRKPTQRPKYKVVFFDGVVAQIEPDWFWTTTDEEFATCNLGESTGNYGLDNDNDAIDELEGVEDFNQPSAPEDEETLRMPSPLPSLPPPKPEVFEYELSIAEQFEYVKPMLAAVLDDVYEPAKARTAAFMRGGGVRKRVLDTVPFRGSLSARDKEEVAFLVRSWARRRERRREMDLDVEYPRDKLYPAEDNRTAGESPDGQEDDCDSVLTPVSDQSTGDPELLAGGSEADVPPSSLVPTEIETDDEKEASVGQDAPKHEVAPEDTIDVSPPVECSTASGDVPVQTADTVPHISEDDKRAADGVACAPPRPSFHDLDTVEKITYCNNILLQEAILQLLLWRTGQRKALGLLSPKEEQRLHALALEEGEKTDWVHDIIRLRQAVEKTMLPSGKAKEKGKEAVAAAVGTGVRARKRREA